MFDVVLLRICLAVSLTGSVHCSPTGIVKMETDRMQEEVQSDTNPDSDMNVRP